MQRSARYFSVVVDGLKRLRKWGWWIYPSMLDLYISSRTACEIWPVSSVLLFSINFSCALLSSHWYNLFYLCRYSPMPSLFFPCHSSSTAIYLLTENVYPTHPFILNIMDNLDERSIRDSSKKILYTLNALTVTYWMFNSNKAMIRCSGINRKWVISTKVCQRTIFFTKTLIYAHAK